LKLNENNYLSILAAVTAGDVLVITSMVPSATPNEEVYIQMVNRYQEPTVYRANEDSRTWLVEPLQNTSNVLWVDDARKLVDIYATTVTVPQDYDYNTNPLEVGLPVDKSLISKITVYNDTTNNPIFETNYELEIQDLAPVLVINGSIQPGEQLTITVVLGIGNTIYLNGEQIKFTTVNLDFNLFTGLQRGVNGTGIQKLHNAYSTVYGMLSTNRMTAALYDNTWNSNNFNEISGDPLQISDTAGANFLNSGNS
jgi:hypothetical protein